MQPRNATALDYTMLVYFLVLIVLVNWKGNAFLNWGKTHRWGQLLVALGLFIPWALYVLSPHL